MRSGWGRRTGRQGEIIVGSESCSPAVAGLPSRVIRYKGRVPGEGAALPRRGAGCSEGGGSEGRPRAAPVLSGAILPEHVLGLRMGPSA